MKKTWLQTWMFPLFGLIAILEVGAFGFLMSGVVSTQQHNSAAIVQNEGDIAANTTFLKDHRALEDKVDTLASNARKIEETQALIKRDIEQDKALVDKAQKTLG